VSWVVGAPSGGARAPARRSDHADELDTVIGARTGTEASWPRRRGTRRGRGGRSCHGTNREVRGRRQAVVLELDAEETWP